MAELADALASGASGRKAVQVQPCLGHQNQRFWPTRPKANGHQLNDLDFIDYWNYNRGVASGVVEDMGDIFPDFFFQGFELGVGGGRFVGFNPQVVTDFPNQFL